MRIDTITLKEFLDNYTTLQPNGCRTYNGDRSTKGYGRVSVNYEKIYAHRIALALHLGVSVSSLTEVRHTCDNPPCCEPSHLIDGTHADNMRDAKVRGLYGKKKKRTHCKKGHELIGENLVVNKDGSMRCKTCCNNWYLRNYGRKKYA